MFKFLPDAKIQWRDVWIGAVMTAILFGIGKWLLGLYLSSGAAGAAYGLASSLVTLLLWVYYSSQILLFGAEFTQVYADRAGARSTTGRIRGADRAEGSRDPLKILFVCIKNASRSPMAEALLKMSARRGRQVCSAGIKPGRDVNEQAVKVMREVGCDLSGHKPRHFPLFLTSSSTTSPR